MRWQLLLVIAVVLLIRLPFLNQAIQGDDVYYLAGAEHTQVDPAHPNHARYVFQGEEVSMQGHPHPPLNVWCLAGLLALIGDIREVPFHAAYIAFSLVAALGMWTLARRFSPRPCLATLLFLAVPAFVVNGNSLESDLPLLAFWMASAALFVGAVDSGSLRRLTGAALTLALAAMAGYQALLIIPILAVYLWAKRSNWGPAWAALLAGPAMLVAWQLGERLSTGEMPVSVAVGYFQTYNFQAVSLKVRSAAALTGHAGWLIFPVLALAAFRPRARRPWLVLAACTVAAACADPNPLFWCSAGVGVAVLIWCAGRLRKSQDPDTRFLAAWVLVFFAGALVLFFAGSARYLLPMAAPVALLATRALDPRPAWLATGVGLQMIFSLGLSLVNYQHWDGYRQFARALGQESETRRVWINGEWGLRYYFESEGGLPVLRGQVVQPGDVVVSSELAFPVGFTTGGGALAPVAQRDIHASLPLRIIGLGARSAYSSAGFGLRPFDITGQPIDRVRAMLVVERKPALSYLPMNAPEAGQQIASGVHPLEEGRWRWMSGRAVVLLKRPERPSVLEVVLYIPPASPARRVSVTVDNVPVAEKTYAAAGPDTLISGPVTVSSETATVMISVDKTFSAPGDQRQLGIILNSVGFKPKDWEKTRGMEIRK